MPLPDKATIISEDDLGRWRDTLARVAADQAAALVPGCATWRAETLEGFDSRITVWPDRRRAALAADEGSHWGEWDDARGELRLDNGDVVGRAGGVGEDA